MKGFASRLVVIQVLFIGTWSAIQLDLIRHVTPASVALTASVLSCWLVWLRRRYVLRYNRLTGFNSTLGLNGALGIIMASRRRAMVSISVHELLSSIPFLFPQDKSGIFATFVGPMPIIMLWKAHTAKVALFHEKSQRKGQHYDTIRYAIGDGLITSSAKRWFSHRKLLTPAFHFKILQSLVPIASHQAGILVARMDEEASGNANRSIANLSTLISDCTLDVLCQSSMGIDLGCQLNSEKGLGHYLRQAFELFAAITISPWLWNEFILKLSTIGKQYMQCIHHLRSLSTNVIANRRNLHKETIASGDDSSIKKGPEPFIDILIREHLKNPENFSLEDIQDETNVFLVAGHDTTGWSIIYTIFMLGHHPHIQSLVHEEVDRLFDEHGDDALTLEVVKHLTYMDAVIKETMRLYPPVPMVARTAEDDIEIDGHILPKGSELLIGIYLMHRDPTVWPNPHRFKPERFFDELPNPYAYIPFSAGPRNCIGQRYALIQAKCVLATILRKFTIQSITQEDHLTPYFAPNLTSSVPVQVKLLRRTVAASA